MSIRWGERPKQTADAEYGRYGATREYWVSGTFEKVDALVTIAQNAPRFDTITDPDGNEITVFRTKMNAQEEGGGCWVVPVVYSNTPDTYQLKFNNGVQSTKVLQALQHIRTYDCIDGEVQTGATTNVPDFGGAIGVTGDGPDLKVEGTDVEIGKMEFSITKKSKYADLDGEYEAYLGTVTPSVNQATWAFMWKTQLFVFVKGCVLFRGHTTDQTSEGDLSITHNFAYSKPFALDAAAWDVSKTYALGDQVTYGSGVNGHHLFKSAANGNVGNTPAVIADWDTAVNYVIGNKVKTSGGFEYQASANNIGERPDLFPAHWTLLGLLEWTDLGAATEFTVGGSAPIEKEGWQYGWPWYKPAISAGAVFMKPTGFMIEKVLDYSDFNKLKCF